MILSAAPQHNREYLASSSWMARFALHCLHSGTATRGAPLVACFAPARKMWSNECGVSCIPCSSPCIVPHELRGHAASRSLSHNLYRSRFPSQPPCLPKVQLHHFVQSISYARLVLPVFHFFVDLRTVSPAADISFPQRPSQRPFLTVFESCPELDQTIKTKVRCHIVPLRDPTRNFTLRSAVSTPVALSLLGKWPKWPCLSVYCSRCFTQRIWRPECHK